MNRWYRQTFPHAFLAYTYFAVILLADVAGLLAWWTWGQRISDPFRFELLNPFLMIGVISGAPAAVALAIYKAHRFPGSGSDHSEWLATTPWQSNNRAPFGPWHPVLSDVLPLTILAIVGAVHGIIASWCLPEIPDRILGGGAGVWQVAFAAGAVPIVTYLVAWTLCGYVQVVGNWNWSAYTPILTAGTCILLTNSGYPTVALVIGISAAVAATALVWQRMHFVLRQLPSRHLTDRDVPAAPRKSSDSINGVYPYAVKSPVIQWLEQHRPHAFAYGLLVFVYASAWLATIPWDRAGLLLLPFAVAIMAFARAVAYTERHASHLGLRARWATRTFVVREYDRVWIPSLWMLVAAAASTMAGYFEVIPPGLTAAFCISSAVVIGMASGPDFERWALTAPHRMNRRANAQRRGHSGSQFNTTATQGTFSKR